MKRSIVFICALFGALLLFAEETNESVSVIFDSFAPKGKTRQAQSHMYRIKCGEKVEMIPYGGTEELIARLCGKFHIGQPIELSMLEYTSAREVARIFAALTLTNLFAFPGQLIARRWSDSNVLESGAFDRLGFYSFAEARTRYRYDCYNRKLQFQQNNWQRCNSQDDIFCNYIAREACISNVVLEKHKVVEARNNVFFPDLDCLMICDPADPRQILAACHFVGGDIFPFEGKGRGLPTELRPIFDERFVRIDFEKRVEQEFGQEFAGLSGEALCEKILNSPYKDRALELLHFDSVKTSFGELDYVGSIPAIISFKSSAAEEECSCDIFATYDRRLYFVTYQSSALCVWMIFDKAFWAL